MIAEFWNMTKPAIRAAFSRGVYDNVEGTKCSNKRFFKKYSALVAFSPHALSEEVKFDILRQLPTLLREEAESGIYGPAKTLEGNTTEPKSLKHTKYSDSTPKYDMREPAPLLPDPNSESEKRKARRARRKEPARILKVAERFPKRKKFEKDYLEAMADIVTLHDWEQIVVRAINDAVGGDAKARTWISDYLIGKPITRIAAIQKIENTVMGEDERAELMRAVFSEQVAGGNILDVEPLNAEPDEEPAGVIVADETEVGGWSIGSEHVVVSTSKE